MPGPFASERQVLERIMCNCLQEHLEGTNGLSKRQFGFRKARSTVDVISTVTTIAQEACSGGHTRIKFCAVIALDVKNTFNLVNWTNVLMSLEGLAVPEYLLRIIRSYLSDRILYGTKQGMT